MSFNKKIINKNLKRRNEIIDKACGDCWWVKQYVMGNLYYYRLKKEVK
mgnify:CR=1 FL=1|tara:strand:- start:173 stop:316 length:144 start_codon:yes stop_codon:yes gene_type:complete